MSIVDDLIENLVERNAIDLTGTLRIAVVDGGLSIKGIVNSTVRDQRKNKEILKIAAPVDARVNVGEVIIPLPHIK